MLCSKEELVVYKKYYESVQNGIVKPYDDSIIKSLSIYKNIKDNKMNSYLESLCSTYSIGKSHMYSLYLMQFLDDKKFKVYNGYLSNLTDEKYSHTWIESDEEVYDVAFIGKWPKDVYYEIFNPIKKNEVELDSEEYKNIKRNNTIVKPNKNTLKYFDWYSYMNNNTVTTHAFNESLKSKDFPVLTKKI